MGVLTNGQRGDSSLDKEKSEKIDGEREAAGQALAASPPYIPPQGQRPQPDPSQDFNPVNNIFILNLEILVYVYFTYHVSCSSLIFELKEVMVFFGIN